MSDANDAESPPGPTSATARVSLLEMVVAAEIEAQRLETWTRMTADPEARIWMARRSHVARMTVRTLDILRDNEKDFVEIVRKKNEVAQRKAKTR